MTPPFSVQIRDDAAWLTVHGNDIGELTGNLAAAVGDDRAYELLARFTAVQNLAAGGLNPQPVAPQAPPVSNYNPYAAPPAPPAPPAGGGWNQPPAPPQGGGGDWKASAPMCSHGQRRPYEGTYKNGRNAGNSYRAYFCAGDKNAPDKCQPLDADTMKAWG